MAALGHRLGSFVIAMATALGIVALVIPLFLNPLWVGLEQGRSQAAAWTGFDDASLRTATDAILSDLIVGPPDFDVAVGGTPVLDERERAHMRDVRTVFEGFFVVTAVVLVAGVIVVLRRRRHDRAASWRAMRGGAVGLIVTLLTLGVMSFVAFDTLFEVFHRLFFAGGTYTFDPATERLVQLFPFQFWQETAIVLGAVAILVAIVVAVVANGRAERAERAAIQGAAAVSSASAEVAG